MWTEIAAVLVLVLVNCLCYASHHRSVLHSRFKLPKLAYVSNRITPGLTEPKSSETYWQLDVIRASDLVTSWFIDEVTILVLRCCEALFFALTLLVEGTTGDGFGASDRWLTFFTNWTFVLFGCWALLGVLLSGLHLQGRLKLCHGHATQNVETGCWPAKPVEQWTCLPVVYCFVSQVCASATLFLSVFYWAILYKKGPIAPDNLLKHGINNMVILADVMLTRVPFASYHTQVLVWYGSAYLVFMWIYHGASAHWVYQILDWTTPLAVVLYLALPVLLFASAACWFGVARGREVLGGRYERSQAGRGRRVGWESSRASMPAYQGLEEDPRRGAVHDFAAQTQLTTIYPGRTVSESDDES